ncbi:hypothetical protein L7F22_019816 [Adiantum nelumboides]|nr:hypothetical protein [Adiantum nelumboides]
MTKSGDAFSCRWGILGCGTDAAQFAADLQSNQTTASSSSKPLIKHTIVAVASTIEKEARAFADTHVRLNKGDDKKAKHVEAFGTSTELHAHPSIDAIYIGGPQIERYREATSAIRGGKAVLLYKPIAMTRIEAGELCELAERDKKHWLGIVMRKQSQEKGLLWAADECAIGISASKAESEKLTWNESLSILEALDEIRESGSPLTIHHPTTAAFPKIESPEEVRTSLDGTNHIIQPKRTPSRSSERSDATFHSSHANTGDDSLNGSSVSKAALRSQVHELKHVLRQKNAIITTLEQKAGIQSSSSGARRVPRSRNSLPAAGAASLSPLLGGGGRRSRASSMERTTDSFQSSDSNHLSENNKEPFSDIANTADTPGNGNGMAINRRRRKDANSSGLTNGYSTPEQSPLSNQLGLETVPEGRKGSQLALGEGFLSPTIASENRRLANTAAVLGSPVTSSPGQFTPASQSGGQASKGSGKVIESLTNELNAARSALDDTKMQLRTCQRTVTSLQRSLDETREALGRSRAENEASVQMLSRKDRQHQEVLERARKAEAESKELGKSSREWGARVRKIEAELGEERVTKQRAEMQYDAISTTWKQTREAWEKEMKELRMTHGETAKRNREALEEMQKRYKQVDQEGERVHAAIADLQEERTKAARSVIGPVNELMEQLREHEKHTSSHDIAVEEVQSELKRILRLMRTPT